MLMLMLTDGSRYHYKWIYNEEHNEKQDWWEMQQNMEMKNVISS